LELKGSHLADCLFGAETFHHILGIHDDCSMDFDEGCKKRKRCGLDIAVCLSALRISGRRPVRDMVEIGTVGRSSHHVQLIQKGDIDSREETIRLINKTTSNERE
jgi:hypothetical protein